MIKNSQLFGTECQKKRRGGIFLTHTVVLWELNYDVKLECWDVAYNNIQTTAWWTSLTESLATRSTLSTLSLVRRASISTVTLHLMNDECINMWFIRYAGKCWSKDLRCYAGVISNGRASWQVVWYRVVKCYDVVSLHAITSWNTASHPLCTVQHMVCFYRAMHFSPKRSLALACRPSVRLWRWWIVIT